MRDGGPAFPGDDGPYTGNSGMTLRDWFAGQALAGMLNSKALAHLRTETQANAAYGYADAMIAARNEQEPNPLKAELDEAKARIEHLESLRPHWAQGYSTDSIAAQTATSALVSIWKMLGVENQTSAMARLRQLLGDREA